MAFRQHFNSSTFNKLVSYRRAIYHALEVTARGGWMGEEMPAEPAGLWVAGGMGCSNTLLSLLRLFPSAAVGPDSAYPEGLGVAAAAPGSHCSRTPGQAPCDGLDMAAGWLEVSWVSSRCPLKSGLVLSTCESSPHPRDAPHVSLWGCRPTGTSSAFSSCHLL